MYSEKYSASSARDNWNLMKIEKNRSSHPEVLRKKGVLKNFVIFTGKHLWQSLSFNKVPSNLQLY